MKRSGTDLIEGLGFPGRLMASVMVAAAVAFGWNFALSRGAAQSQTPVSSSLDPWQTNQVVEPEDLAKAISGAAGGKPLVVHVGFPSLYKRGHVLGALAAGPASTANGVEELRRLVKNLPRAKPIIFYCGCCPWKDCPNIRPAFRALAAMGFKNIRILDLPNDFPQDWAKKGFPTERRSPANGPNQSSGPAIEP